LVSVSMRKQGLLGRKSPTEVYAAHGYNAIKK